MKKITTEHDVRDAVQSMAADASAPPLPGQEILRAGLRRRVRRRVERAGALAMAATAVAAVAWTQTSGGSAAEPAGPPTVTNTFTDQLGQVLGQILPEAKVSAAMYSGTDPNARHYRFDVFPLRITYRGHVLDAALSLRTGAFATTGPDSGYCGMSAPWKTKMSDCTSKPVANGGLVGAYKLAGPGHWVPGDLYGSGGKPLTVLQSDITYSQKDATHVGVAANLTVRAGTTSNDSGLTPAGLSTTLQDPRFAAFLRDFADHPEKDPYGPLAKINDRVVASGKVDDHAWALHFAILSEYSGSIFRSKVNDNCDYWAFTVDGSPLTGNADVTCKMDGSLIHNQPPTNKAAPWHSDRLYPTDGTHGHAPQLPIGTVLTSTVPAGTVSVEATFDDQPTKLTGKAFTVHGDIPYFVLVKPDTAKPDWKLATVICQDSDGKVVGTLYFNAP
ncbi:hypothetical protein ABH926_009983 [Catenulispora sp. GP43]|uniref:hypothetical protein n=1 Tax=Catenulispora sp. GP43 TaxID=3156263 RepID=UPI00351443A2